MIAGIVRLWHEPYAKINAMLNNVREDGIPVHNKKETAVRHYLTKKKHLDLEEGKVLFRLDPKLLRG